MKKKILAITLALCLVFAMTSVAFAADKNTDVHLVVSDDAVSGGGSGTIATVDVTVPTKIVITAQPDTVVATVEQYSIKNNAKTSYIVLDALELTAAEAGNWTKAAYSETAFKALAYNTKQFAMRAKIGEGQYTDLNNKWTSINQNINAEDTLSVSLEALIPTQSQAINDVQIAKLVATISLSTAA